MATNHMPLGDKIIRKHDYRHFELGVTPVSDGHYEHIRYLYTRIENYFKDRPEVKIDRKIYNDHNSSRTYVMRFAILDDARMFELHFAEYVSTCGVKYP